MKKLMFATALVASVAAFADPAVLQAGSQEAMAAPTAINAISFEGYGTDATLGVNGVAEKTEDPQSQYDKGVAYFCYKGGDQDGSLVKAFGTGEGEIAAPNITRPTYFASDTNNKYLELSTEGGILWRSINPVQGQGANCELGAATNITADGIYLDTLMQFTPTEDGNTPDYDADNDKLVIWLNIDSSGAAPVTNLMVRAAVINADGDPTPTTFTITNKTASAGEWYRVTIKAFPDISGGDEIPGFQIRLDGDVLMSDTPTLDSDYLEIKADSEYGEELKNGALFASLLGTDSSPTLQAIGFKGSGALDDIVWTVDAPSYPAASIDFTLTWPSGVTPVSYTVDGGEAVPLSGETSPFAVPNLAGGEAIVFTFTNADGVTKTMNATAADDGDIDASTATYEWPEYLGAAVDGAYTIDDAHDLDMLRRGVDAGIATTGETFKQTANIDMTSEAAFAGIGVYNANPTSGTPFAGTYDGQGFKIENVTMLNRNYGGVFNQINGGTVKNLTVSNITVSATATGEYGFAIIGNVGNGATLQGLVMEGSILSAAKPGTHNVAGIVVRACGGSENGTLIKDCTNNASLYGNYTKLGGICALTQHKQDGGPVTFDGCVNNGSLTSARTETGITGIAGIVGYTADATVLKNCVNNGTITVALANQKVGELVGSGGVESGSLTDAGGNKADATKKMLHTRSNVTGFLYATVDNGVATTVLPPLTVGTTYLLESNVAASETPVATLTAVGDSISFDTALGYTFAGTVASSGAAGFPVATTADGVITYTVGYFPRTATPGQDGTAANPFEIADVDDFQALQAATAADASYRGLAYKQIEDVNMSSAGEFSITSVFSGVFDGGNHAISNVQLIPAKQTGFFQKLANATVSNLTVSATFSSTTASIGGAIFAGDVTGTCRFEHVITEGSFSGTHNCSGMVGNDSAKSASTDITFAGCTNRAAVTTTYTKAAGLMNYTEKAGAKVTFIDCANEGNITCAGGASAGGAWAGGFMAYIGAGNTTHSLTRCVNTGNISATQDTATTGNNSFRVGGLLGNVATVPLTDCSNSGTISGVATAVGSSPVDSVVGGLVGYGTVTLAGDCSNSGSVGYTLPAGNYTFASKGSLVGYGNPTVSAGATITAPATEKPIGKGSCAALNFAEVDNGVATFCGADAITSNKTYNVMLDNAAAFQFGATAGDYVTLVNSPATYTGTCEGENPTVTTAASGLTVSVQAVMGAYTYVLGSAGGYPTYLADADADVKAAYDTWKVANGADTNSEYENQFLVNAAPATVVPATALAITAIEQNETAGWDITVECTVQGIDLGGTVGTAKVGNGYLAVSYTDDLTGTWTTENIAITASANGKVTVNVNKAGAKFMKVKLSPVQEPQN